MEELITKYPWLSTTTTVEDYVEPKYYDLLLKEYSFSSKKDLEFLEEFLKKHPVKQNLSILELGCGSGRATKIALEHLKGNFQLVDLSSRMITFCKQKFNKKQITFVNTDLLSFLNSTDATYDIIFSLWSFSHAVHQALIIKGTEKGTEYVRQTINKMILQNMKKSSSFFLIHFDSLSDEQKILMKQWRRVFPIYSNNTIQSPSKTIIDNVLQALQKKGFITLKCTHLRGDDIVYKSAEEALEIFMNFHMESYFNNSPLASEIIDDLLAYFKKFTLPDGTIRIKPGCFIYEVTKVN